MRTFRASKLSLLVQIGLLSSIILLYLCQLSHGFCVWQGGGGFRLACGFRQSGLFRIRSLGGLKGWAGAGFTVGDEDGFKDSLSNKDKDGNPIAAPAKNPQYSSNYLQGSASNLVPQKIIPQNAAEVAELQKYARQLQYNQAKLRAKTGSLQKRSSLWESLWPWGGSNPGSKNIGRKRIRPGFNGPSAPAPRGGGSLVPGSFYDPTRNRHQKSQNIQNIQQNTIFPQFKPLPDLEPTPGNVERVGDLQKQQNHNHKTMKFSHKKFGPNKKPYGLRLLQESENYGKKFFIEGEDTTRFSDGKFANQEESPMYAGYDPNIFPDIYFTTTTQGSSSIVEKIPTIGTNASGKTIKIDPKSKKFRKIKIIRNKSGKKKGGKIQIIGSTTSEKPENSVEMTTFSQNFEESSSKPKLLTKNQILEELQKQFFGSKLVPITKPSTTSTTTTTTTTTEGVFLKNKYNNRLQNTEYDPRYPPNHEFNRRNTFILPTAATSTTFSPFLLPQNQYNFNWKNGQNSQNLQNLAKTTEATSTTTEKMQNLEKFGPSIVTLSPAGDSGQFVKFDSTESEKEVNKTLQYNQKFYQSHYGKSGDSSFNNMFTSKMAETSTKTPENIPQNIPETTSDPTQNQADSIKNEKTQIDESSQSLSESDENGNLNFGLDDQNQLRKKILHDSENFWGPSLAPPSVDFVTNNNFRRLDTHYDDNLMEESSFIISTTLPPSSSSTSRRKKKKKYIKRRKTTTTSTTTEKELDLLEGQQGLVDDVVPSSDQNLLKVTQIEPEKGQIEWTKEPEMDQMDQNNNGQQVNEEENSFLTFVKGSEDSSQEKPQGPTAGEFSNFPPTDLLPPPPPPIQQTPTLMQQLNPFNFNKISKIPQKSFFQQQQNQQNLNQQQQNFQQNQQQQFVSQPATQMMPPAPSSPNKNGGGGFFRNILPQILPQIPRRPPQNQQQQFPPEGQHPFGPKQQQKPQKQQQHHKKQQQQQQQQLGDKKPEYKPTASQLRAIQSFAQNQKLFLEEASESLRSKNPEKMSEKEQILKALEFLSKVRHESIDSILKETDTKQQSTTTTTTQRSINPTIDYKLEQLVPLLRLAQAQDRKKTQAQDLLGSASDTSFNVEDIASLLSQKQQQQQKPKKQQNPKPFLDQPHIAYYPKHAGNLKNLKLIKGHGPLPPGAILAGPAHNHNHNPAQNREFLIHHSQNPLVSTIPIVIQTTPTTTLQNLQNLQNFQNFQNNLEVVKFVPKSPSQAALYSRLSQMTDNFQFPTAPAPINIGNNGNNNVTSNQLDTLKKLFVLNQIEKSLDQLKSAVVGPEPTTTTSTTPASYNVSPVAPLLLAVNKTIETIGGIFSGGKSTANKSDGPTERTSFFGGLSDWSPTKVKNYLPSLPSFIQPGQWSMTQGQGQGQSQRKMDNSMDSVNHYNGNLKFENGAGNLNILSGHGPTERALLALKALAIQRGQGLNPSPTISLPQQQMRPQDVTKMMVLSTLMSSTTPTSLIPGQGQGQHGLIDLSAILGPTVQAQQVPNWPAQLYQNQPSKLPSNSKRKLNLRNAPKSFYPGDKELQFDPIPLESYSDFSCEDQKFFPGLYADTALSCKVFHLCAKTEKGSIMKSFACPKETVFDQEVLRCNWSMFVECPKSKDKYHFNQYLSQSFQFLKILGDFSTTVHNQNQNQQNQMQIRQ